jgi:hypothetical protein
MNTRWLAVVLVFGPMRPRIVPATTIEPAFNGSSVYWLLPRCRTSEK